MDEHEEKKTIDMINFALLAFLSDTSYKAKKLQDLLDQFTGIELSRTPFYRRMRGLVDDGYVSEEKVDAFGTVLYTITDKGKQFCLEWAGKIQVLVGLALYTLEYTQTEEYANETK